MEYPRVELSEEDVIDAEGKPGEDEDACGHYALRKWSTPLQDEKWGYAYDANEQDRGTVIVQLVLEQRDLRIE